MTETYGTTSRKLKSGKQKSTVKVLLDFILCTDMNVLKSHSNRGGVDPSTLDKPKRN